jgi:hypothetical protein
LEKRAEQVLPGSEEAGEQRGKVAQTMYTHMNKCINNKKMFLKLKKKCSFT